MSSFIYGIVWFIIGGVAIYAVVRKDKHGMSILYRIILRFGWKRQQLAHRKIYLSGPLSRIPHGNFRLPSIGANTSLITYFDPHGRDVGVLFHNNRFITIVLHGEPEGAQLVDAELIDLQVSRFSTFLNSLSDEPGLYSVSICIETEPENGVNLQEEIKNQMSQSASEFAQQTMSEIGQSYHENSFSTSAYIALTYSLDKLNATKRSVDDILHDVVARIPLLAGQLEVSGVGVCHTMSTFNIYKLIRTSFDPAIKRDFDSLDVDADKSKFNWADVGPSIAVNEWDKYITDNATHRSYVMSQPPRGEVTCRVLETLLSPSKTFTRKRITLIYMPMQYEESAVKVESDLTNAVFKATSQNRPTARQEMAVVQAQQTASEEARGSRLINFGMIVTITLGKSEDISSADALISNISAASRVVLRTAYGTQDSAFLAGLPLGLPLETFYSTFDNIKDMI